VFPHPAPARDHDVIITVTMTIYVSAKADRCTMVARYIDGLDKFPYVDASNRARAVMQAAR
jgi:hypothetical protein